MDVINSVRLTLSVPVFIFSAAITSACAVAPARANPLISAPAVNEFISEIERLDGEVIELRHDRPQRWAEIVDSIKSDFENAKTLSDLDRTFRKLDLAYSSRHASVKILDKIPENLVPSATFTAESIDLNKIRLLISSVDPEFPQSQADRPRPGDIVIGINGRSLSSWLAEGFTFCKFPLKSQCDAEFADNFRMQRFSWNQSQPLEYTLQRGEKVWAVRIPLRKPRNGSVSVDMGSGCAQDSTRYRDFTLAYAGLNACFFKSILYPRTAILRVSSFRYEPHGALDSVEDEVNALAKWLKRNGNFENLVLDLVDNSGGDSPASYFRLLVDQPFLSSYLKIRFKKNRELENSSLRSALFWKSQSNESWFRKLNQTKQWDQISWGDFLPPIPNECRSQGACRNGKMIPEKEPYLGRVNIIVNRMCMSACDHFIYMAQRLLKNRVRFIGEPPTADTGYGRLRLHLLKIPIDGRWTVVTDEEGQVREPTWASQSLVVTRTEDGAGNIVDGHPIVMDQPEPTALEIPNHTWLDRAVQSAKP